MTKKFTILTESGFLFDRIKRVVLRFGGKILGRKIYGPVAVLKSFTRGLEELNKKGSEIIYNVNPSTEEVHKTVVVLMLEDTLRYTLELKKQGKITYIYAGPAISVPLDNKNIFFHEGVDRIIVPSLRVANYFESISPESRDKLLVRPAGVSDYSISLKKSHKLLIYKKTCPDELYIYIINKLKKEQIPYNVVEYGKFDFNTYMNNLNDCIGMIYLQESESQGLALQEARMKDIPTLVWNRGFWQYQTAYREDNKISAPYMIDDCGLFFGNTEDFDGKLLEFMANIYEYKPREYCIKALTDEATTKLLLDHINK